MPIGDRGYIRGSHPPYCTCKDCTDRRLRKWQDSARWTTKTTKPHRVTRRNKPSGALLGFLLTLVVVFILLLLGLVVWSLSGGQTSPSTNPPTAVTEPLPQSHSVEVPGSTLTPPPVETPPVPEATRPPATPTGPSALVQPPVYQYEELVEYALELINRNREANGLASVTLGNNTAAQKHAEERLANRYGSHWDMDGLKPYMRYTLAGGENYEAENGFMTETFWIGDKNPSFRIDPKEKLEEAQQGLMASPGHRKNILDKWHKKVNLGIAYDDERLDLVQQFEGGYIDFSELPNISGNILSMTGQVTLGTIENVSLYYDPLPQPLSPEQLDAPPYDYAYGLGEDIGTILPPLPADYFYIDLFPNDVIAITWDIESDSSFTIEADVSPILEEGKGVYTVVVWVETGGEFVAISNFSIFIQ